nr:hypothetical protein [Actinomycetota bacterium]
MRRKLSIAILCLGLVAPLQAAPAQAHDAPNRCGQKPGFGAGWFKVRGHDVGCAQARKVARRWENKCVRDGRCDPGGPAIIHVWPTYTCRDDQAGYESVRVKCTARGDRIVHFYWGS